MERSEMSASQDGRVGQGPFFELAVDRIIEETHDSRSIVLAVPQALSETFAYKAGQFLSFGITIGDHHLVRCYSLASSPDTESEHKVTIKRVEEGRVSNWFHDALEVGDVLHVMKPAGHFCLQAHAAPIVMFGGGSGITPIISIVKSALATTDRRISLVYANRDERSVIFRDELNALVAAQPDRFTLIHSLDEIDGFLSVDQARQHLRATPDADVYVCGPGAYMDIVEEALAAESIPGERIFIERFVSPELAALDAEPPADLGDACAIVQVYLDGEVKPVPVHEGETILAAAHRAGLDAPCACMEGYCGSCMAFVKEGEVDMKLNDGGLDSEQVEAGWVLTCQTQARSTRARLDYPDPD
jgi:3-ketosteroid 9alpha-monooxygenase subunit B